MRNVNIQGGGRQRSSRARASFMLPALHGKPRAKVECCRQSCSQKGPIHPAKQFQRNCKAVLAYDVRSLAGLQFHGFAASRCPLRGFVCTLHSCVGTIVSAAVGLRVGCDFSFLSFAGLKLEVVKPSKFGQPRFKQPVSGSSWKGRNSSGTPVGL